MWVEAVKKHEYDNKLIHPGERYEASDRFGKILTLAGITREVMPETMADAPSESPTMTIATEPAPMPQEAKRRRRRSYERRDMIATNE